MIQTIYVLQEFDYDDRTHVGTFKGPAGLDIVRLREKFYAQFDDRGLGKPEYPEYKGPTIEKPAGNQVSCCSGSVCGGLMPDTSSNEFNAWSAAHDKIGRDWQRRRNAAIAAARKKYPGKELGDMFVSYLRKEHGLRPINNVEMVDV